jgi:DNA-binding MarR family transcriptional regulator
MAEPRWLTDPEMRAWLGYRRMRTLLDLQISRDLATDSGLSDADFDVLSNLSQAAGRRMRLSDLAAHIFWSVSRLSHHVTRMEQRGLVTREECASDGRGAVLALTEAGWDTVVAAGPPYIESVRRHFIDHLTPGQITALTAITETVVGHLSRLPSPARGPRAAPRQSPPQS